MQAIILAGGKGRRLAPYTTVLPKPLMPIHDRPILEIVVNQLVRYGTTEIFIAAGHLAHLIEAYFGNGERYGVPISYSLEEEPLGTAGPIAGLIDRLDESFIVLNGDLLTTINFRKLFDAHIDSNCAATIAVHKRQQKIDFGVLEIDSDGLLARYTEKPTFDFIVSMGINVFRRDLVRQFLLEPGYLDIPELMEMLQAEGMSILCHEQECHWLDIGRVDDYRRAQELFQSQDFGVAKN